MVPLQEKLRYFHSTQLARLDLTQIPRHVAIIPDGNRRWAKKRCSSAQEGHREGADILMDIVKAAKELHIKAITFYVFSTENWDRPKEEVNALMALFASYLQQQCEEMILNGIKLETIGESNRLPGFLNHIIEESKKATLHCDKIRLILALNYGARNEICRAVRSIIDEYDRHSIKKEDINEDLISKHLDTANWGDPDLLIRTSGEFRISNFLLWQLSYTEIHVAPVLWPDFTSQHLLEAIIDYQRRERRWGRV
jgi:undecaprenyl diphosphate synthase